MWSCIVKTHEVKLDMSYMFYVQFSDYIMKLAGVYSVAWPPHVYFP